MAKRKAKKAPIDVPGVTEPAPSEAALTHTGPVAPPPNPDPEASFVIEDAKGNYVIVACDRNERKMWRRLHGGANYEHVSDDAQGRWVYRAC